MQSMAHPVPIPISTCYCPEVGNATPTGSENDLKQLVILAIVSLVLTKMGYHQVSSIAQKKDLHSKLEAIQQTFVDGSQRLPSGSQSERI